MRAVRHITTVFDIYVYIYRFAYDVSVKPDTTHEPECTLRKIRLQNTLCTSTVLYMFAPLPYHCRRWRVENGGR